MALPGFRDFYPDDCAFRNAIFAKWREVSRRYGFVEYDGPPLEPLDLFTKKSGDEITAQLYHFKDKGDRDVALRPEMTPTLARLVTARHKDFKKPLKWFSIPQVFRYERPQKGRGREHYQLNCDIIGEAGLEADIELIALVIDVLRSFGLTEKDFVVRLSDRQFWTDFSFSRGIPEDRQYELFQIIDKIERRPREESARLLDDLQKISSEDSAQGGSLSDWVFGIIEGTMQFELGQRRILQVLEGLRNRGLDGFAKIDFGIVRGLAYYTGVVFEAFDRTGEFRAIAGGGRYDTLLKNLGGIDLPALGFGVGDMVLGELLKSKGFSPGGEKRGGVYVAIADEAARPFAMALVQVLRDAAALRVDYPLVPAKLGRQLENASEMGCALAFVIDAKSSFEELQVKDLKARIQSTISRDKIPELLAAIN